MPSQLNDAEAVLQAEGDIRARLGHLPLDFPALAAVSNVYRAATALRNRLERDVLSDAGLTWGGFTILFVLWVWGPMQARPLAEECGLAKGTLTGMVSTLEKRRLVKRGRLDDRRRVEVSLTADGAELIASVFPEFNRAETRAVDQLTSGEVAELSRLLRKVTRAAENGYR